ncbi:hypothetical protein JOC34_000559 [Virgibacillus halotolerans]|uniref:hypothetical protein n=1 Tax=Virgibacillus halotolerans TaxID=1071053 RepID=UPI001961CE2C|nr:hypothetical protein [Virgibacillus halotolerans]MBM7598202.1 hypothetical protein [Virgibacillus halotolerans]
MKKLNEKNKDELLNNLISNIDRLIPMAKNNDEYVKFSRMRLDVLDVWRESIDNKVSQKQEEEQIDEQVLTTGQMIDQLKVGEEAESHSHGYIRVRKNPDGSITQAGAGRKVVLGSGVTDWEWSVVPNYVTFGEAMIVLSRKGRVRFHYRDENGVEREVPIKNSFNVRHSFREDIRWFDLINGKWTIEENHQNK